MSHRVEIFGRASIILGDCLEVLPSLNFDAVITDPPWQQAAGIHGSDDPVGLFARAAIPISTAKRVVVQIGDYSDPSMLAPLSARMPFIRTCWLRYVPPSYRGRMLHEADVAYAFGTPVRSSPGRRVVPSGITSVKRKAEETEFLRKHGRSRTSETAVATGRALPHPMARHLRHVEWLVNWFSDEEETVVDPFAGSGTTGVACLNLGRRFIGIESDARFFDLICARLDRATRQGKL